MLRCCVGNDSGCHAVRRLNALTAVTRIPHGGTYRLGTGKVCVCVALWGPIKETPPRTESYLNQVSSMKARTSSSLLPKSKFQGLWERG